MSGHPLKLFGPLRLGYLAVRREREADPVRSALLDQQAKLEAAAIAAHVAREAPHESAT